VSPPSGGASPVATFPECSHHLVQTTYASLPVELQGLLYALTITLLNGADDSLMLGHGGVEILENRAGVETPIALGFGLNAVVQSEETVAGAGFHQKRVKFAV